MPIASVSAAELRPVAGHAGNPAAAVLNAAQTILPHLEQGRRVDAAVLRGAMENAFGASDAAGAWDWKTAYDACEAATVLFLHKFGPAIRARAASPKQMLPLLDKIAGLLPTHTRRSQESQNLQQFSTPITLGLAACTAAAITSTDLVLEPSAGTGLLAVLARLAPGAVALNELAEMRGALLEGLFPGTPVTRFDAAQIDDYLDPSVSPSVVLMNPPFSVMAHVEGRMADAAFRHIASALARLGEGGRLVAITGANFAPDEPRWHDAFACPARAWPGRVLRGYRRRRLRAPRYDDRHPSARDRQAACHRLSCVSGFARDRARSRNAARLGYSTYPAALAGSDRIDAGRHAATGDFPPDPTD